MSRYCPRCDGQVPTKVADDLMTLFCALCGKAVGERGHPAEAA